jgi:hypothetical protein
MQLARHRATINVNEYFWSTDTGNEKNGRSTGKKKHAKLTDDRVLSRKVPLAESHEQLARVVSPSYLTFDMMW